MYDILAAVDESEERARTQARAIADLPRDPDDLRVVIFHDFTNNPEGASVHQVAAVRRAKEILEDAGVDVELAESSGKPAQTILEIARERDVDLISLSGRRRTPTGKALFGSVTQAVILDADRPVMVSNPSE
jgi:nucleotide-binding universal stress UspA family protein